jgi:hypothetical protein
MMGLWERQDVASWHRYSLFVCVVTAEFAGKSIFVLPVIVANMPQLCVAAYGCIVRCSLRTTWIVTQVD